MLAIIGGHACLQSIQTQLKPHFKQKKKDSQFTELLDVLYISKQPARGFVPAVIGMFWSTISSKNMKCQANEKSAIPKLSQQQS